MNKVVNLLSIAVASYVVYWFVFLLYSLFKIDDVSSILNPSFEMLISKTYREVGATVFLISSFSWYLLGAVLALHMIKSGLVGFRLYKKQIVLFVFFGLLNFNFFNWNYWFFG